ncbi:AP-4 complex subunit epsilon-1-like [Argopecten irradians]|uniref:AP-4 complex subunit epsilon-1-like n=1 Tax=Argopecten irradians TaxID=31199 RepID=UPI003711424E
MSDVVEKTLASIPKFLGGGFLGGGQPSSPKHASVRGFSNFLRQLNRTRSKNDEEQIIRHEIKEMQQKLAMPDISKQQICDCLCRAIFCELLGYDLSSFYIHAVKLAQQGTGFEKRLGYLACSLLLHEDHELILLLINTIQKDLNSSNILDNCAALTVICQLVNSEVIPSVLPLVQEKLKHPRELVRMKAAMCVHHFLVKTPSMADHFQDQFQRILFDKDPSVMSVGVKIYSVLLQSDTSQFPKLAENLVGILNQLISRKLPSEFEFHNVPMPWLQLDILRTLGKLGAGNQQQSELMYPVLKDVIQGLNMKERIAYAILYECIVTISVIYPNEELQREATTCVSRFIRSTNHTLKYIGIKALTALVRCCPESALEHQMTVVELLDDKDQAIQCKTLELLYCMTNPSNVQVVCDRLLHHLSVNTTNNFLQLDLSTKVIKLADKFSCSSEWYVDTVYRLLSSCKTALPSTLIDKVISVIEKECEVDENGHSSEDAVKFQQYILKKSLSTLFQDNISSQLLLVSVWILGECGYLLKNMPSEKVIFLVLKHFKNRTQDVSTKGWMTSSLTKLVCAKVLDKDVVTKQLSEVREEEKETVIKQKLTQIINIAQGQIALLLPTMSSGHAKQIYGMDFTLSFLDDYVGQSLAEGAEPYKAKTLRYQLPQAGSDLFQGLNVESKDTTSESIAKETLSQGSNDKFTGGSEGGSDLSGSQRESRLNLEGVKRVWGKKGLISNTESDVPAPTQIDEDISNKSHDKELEEDKAKKMELASALFSGITPQNNQNNKKMSEPSSLMDSRSRGSESSGSSSREAPSKPLPTTDTGGWRSLHKKTTTENTPSESNGNETRSSIPISEICESQNKLDILSTGYQGDSDQSSMTAVSDLDTDLTMSLYTEETDNLLSDFNTVMNSPQQWGHAINRDSSSCSLDDRPCLPGSTSAHSLYGVLSPDNVNGQIVGMDSENVQQEMESNTTETLYDEYTDDHK